MTHMLLCGSSFIFVLYLSIMRTYTYISGGAMAGILQKNKKTWKVLERGKKCSKIPS